MTTTMCTTIFIIKPCCAFSVAYYKEKDIFQLYSLHTDIIRNDLINISTLFAKTYECCNVSLFNNSLFQCRKGVTVLVRKHLHDDSFLIMVEFSKILVQTDPPPYNRIVVSSSLRLVDTNFS